MNHRSRSVNHGHALRSVVVVLTGATTSPSSMTSLLHFRCSSDTCMSSNTMHGNMSSSLHYLSSSDTPPSSNLKPWSMSSFLHFMSNRVLSMSNPITTCWRTLVKHPLHGSEYIVLELLHIRAGGQTISFSMILSTHTWCRSCHVSRAKVE